MALGGRVSQAGGSQWTGPGQSQQLGGPEFLGGGGSSPWAAQPVLAWRQLDYSQS
jgi:hypothetical protein